MARPPLRAVTPDDKPKKVEPKKIVDALDGSARDVLAAMRHTLARKIDDGDVSSNAIASAYKELRELDRLIREADRMAEEESGVSVEIADTYDPEAI